VRSRIPPRKVVGTMPAALLSVILLASVSSRPLTVVPYHVEDELIFLAVRVNGSGPRTFVLDSGARHSIVDSTAAVALELGALSQDSTRGAGRGTVGRQHLAPLDLKVGEVRYHVADPWAIDLWHAGIRHVDGLVGADLFERFVVRIDPERRMLELYQPEALPPGSGTPIPLTLEDDRLYVDMRLTLSNGISEVHRLRVDTGSSDAASDDLIRRSPVRHKALQGVGLGLSYVDDSGVFETVAIGPYQIHHSWGASNDHPAVGMEILRRFTMTFDVPHRRLYLLPNRHLHDPVPAPPPTR
jgi:hypothetical protein